jgi:hypothetical protein
MRRKQTLDREFHRVTAKQYLLSGPDFVGLSDEAFVQEAEALLGMLRLFGYFDVSESASLIRDSLQARAEATKGETP